MSAYSYRHDWFDASQFTSINPYEHAKILKNDLVSYYTKQKNVKLPLIESLRQCGKEEYIDNKTGEIYYNRCCLQICPICSLRKNYSMVKKATLIDNEFAHEKYITQMVTIHLMEDVTNNNIRKTIQYLNSLCTKMFNCRKYKRNTVGSIKSIEISVGDTGQYHPHIHLLIVCRDFLELSNIRKVIKKFFDTAELFFSMIERKLCVEKFIRYTKKIHNDNVDVEDWYNIKTETKGLHMTTMTGDLKTSYVSYN